MAASSDPMQGFLDALANYSTFGGTTAGNMAKGLIEQAKLQQEQDKLGLARTNTGVNVGDLNLRQRKQALEAPGELAGQSVRGDVLANGQDATFSDLPSYVKTAKTTGGLRPSMLSASSRALGGQMSRSALADSTSGKYTTMAPLPAVPGPTPLPEASALQNLLARTGMGAGAASTAGGILDALKKLLGGGSGGSGGSPAGGSSGRPSGPGSPTSGYSSNGYFDPDGYWQEGPDPNDWLNQGGQNLDPYGNPYGPPPVPNVTTEYSFPGIPGATSGGGPDDSGGYYDEDGNYVPYE